MSLAAVGSASAAVGAQLLLAFLACALFSSICLLDVPPPIHAVTFDDTLDPRDGAERSGWAEPSGWIEPAPLRRDRHIIGEHWRRPATGPGHRVVIAPAGTVFFDGCAVDAATLRRRVDLVELAGLDWLDLRPDPAAPWEAVDGVLATLARAHVGRFRLDNSAFAGAIDAPGAPTPSAGAASRDCPAEPAVVD